MAFSKVFICSLLFSCCFQLDVAAQKQNNQWRFGFNSAIDFNTTPPSSLPGCAIQTQEGSASVADELAGALLFYTDGIVVWNANNQPMPNGTGLLGGTSTLKSSTTAAVMACHNLFITMTSLYRTIQYRFKIPACLARRSFPYKIQRVLWGFPGILATPQVVLATLQMS